MSDRHRLLYGLITSAPCIKGPGGFHDVQLLAYRDGTARLVCSCPHDEFTDALSRLGGISCTNALRLFKLACHGDYQARIEFRQLWQEVADPAAQKSTYKLSGLLTDVLDGQVNAVMRRKEDKQPVTVKNPYTRHASRVLLTVLQADENPDEHALLSRDSATASIFWNATTRMVAFYDEATKRYRAPATLNETVESIGDTCLVPPKQKRTARHKHCLFCKADYEYPKEHIERRLHKKKVQAALLQVIDHLNSLRGNQ